MGPFANGAIDGRTMQHAIWAGVTAAETASQLVLGGLYCSLPALARKHVEWMGFGIGCWGLGIATWSLSTLAMSEGARASLAAMAFTAGATVAVALTIFSLAWMTSSSKLRFLGWLAAVTGVFWQLALGYFNPFAGAASHARGHAIGLGTATAAVAAVGGMFLLYLAALLAIAALLFAQDTDVERIERRVILTGLACLVLAFSFDGIAGNGVSHLPTVFPHAAAGFALLLAVTLLLRYGSLSRGARSAEQRLRNCLEELTTSQAALERAQRELGENKQLAAVGELAAAIAHEVRNPLAIIMNAAAGLRRPTLGSEDRTTLLSILDEETARLNRLVTDLLRYARPVIIKRSSVSITELARRVEGRLEDKHRLSVSIPDQPQLKFVQADANLLRLVFDNLVSNAFQAMPDGGVVKIEVSAETLASEPFVRIDIIDGGQGMDEQVLSRATDPFYTTRPSGTGLGLPIVQRIVEAHGGQLEIESSVGRGTKVSLFLPSVVPPQDSEVGSDAVAEGIRP
jgi:signal transduction histidine kinase